MKKVLCITITVCLLAGLFAIPASAVKDPFLDPSMDWESVLEPVYVMDFSPSADGKFYDSPDKTTEVARIPNPDGIVMINGTVNADNQIISAENTEAGSDKSKVFATQTSATNYSAFSGGVAADDINSGASGAKDDYCLKIVDAATNASGTAKIDFPQTYGGMEDSYHKYRFEMDWKWHTLTGTPPSTSTSLGSPTGATIINFYIGGKTLSLNSKNSNAGETDTVPADARGGGALYFNSASGNFGMFGSGQTTAAEDIDKVTKSAAAFTNAEAGKWVHITVDLDFRKGTIDLLMEGDTETRQISTGIGTNPDIFAKGITGIGVSASTGGDRRVNFVDNVTMSPINSPSASLIAGEVLSDNASYFMDFSPSSDGKFYDSPERTMEVGMTEDADIDIPKGTVNAGGQIINLEDTAVGDKKPKIYASKTNKDRYAAFSGGVAEGDINAGASGAKDDYCLKTVDNETTTGATSATLVFPETYGRAGDVSQKYRFEMDWKWYALTTDSETGTITPTAADMPPATTLVTFYFGTNRMTFGSITAAEYNDTANARGAGALCFKGLKGTGELAARFGLTAATQNTVTEDLGKVTKSAERPQAAESGQWAHITIDFDFAKGTIYAVIESTGENGESVRREISTEITSFQDDFSGGIKSIAVTGSYKDAKTLNYFDNISMTPIMTKEPVVKAEGNQLLWKAVDGAESYKVFYGATEAEARANTTEMTEGVVIDNTSKPGYVIATLDNLEVNTPYYYTLTAVSPNKGESIKSNAVEVNIPENVVSDINFEITGVEQSLATGKASVKITAGKGFKNAINLIAAVYDDDKLIDVKLSDPISFNKGREDTIEVILNGLSTNPTLGMKMKFFLWDTNLMTVKNYKEVSAQSWADLLAN